MHTVVPRASHLSTAHRSHSAALLAHVTKLQEGQGQQASGTAGDRCSNATLSLCHLHFSFLLQAGCCGSAGDLSTKSASELTSTTRKGLQLPSSLWLAISKCQRRIQDGPMCIACPGLSVTGVEWGKEEKGSTGDGQNNAHYSQ